MTHSHNLLGCLDYTFLYPIRSSSPSILHSSCTDCPLLSLSISDDSFCVSWHHYMDFELSHHNHFSSRDVFLFFVTIFQYCSHHRALRCSRLYPIDDFYLAKDLALTVKKLLGMIYHGDHLYCSDINFHHFAHHEELVVEF